MKVINRNYEPPREDRRWAVIATIVNGVAVSFAVWLLVMLVTGRVHP